MLRELRIENLVLFTDCTVPFTTGLNIMTGETGAGKSLLLDALGLVLGARGDAKLVRKGAKQAQVTGLFELAAKHPARAWMDAQGIAMDEDTIILRRQLKSDGRSKAFVNDVAVTQASVKLLGEMLVEIHGQHDQRGLLDPKNHRDVLDAACGASALRASLATAYHAWKAAAARYAECDAQIAQALREEAYLRHMVSELEALEPEPNEEAALIDKRNHAQAYQKSRKAIADMQSVLSGASAPLPQMVQLEKALARTDLPEHIQLPIQQVIGRASSELLELEAQLDELGRQADSTDIDANAEDRLFALRDMARKYRTQVDDLAEVLANAQTQLHNITHQQDMLDAASSADEQTKNAYLSFSAELSTLRHKHADHLCAAICEELAALKMSATQLRVRLEPLEESGWSEAGTEQVQFEVATNKGASFGGLHKVASGGELSRVLLAMKVVLGKDQAIGTAVFDEIDTGTGGAVAEAIGKRLKKLSAKLQVMVVTHLPQIAAMADHHLKIEKTETSTTTETTLHTLSASAREAELARMLSGEEVTDEAKRAAKKMRKVAGNA